TRFSDSDKVIEEQAGCTIAALFERDGEETFRRLESEILADLLSLSGVVATGGGVVLRPDNRDLLRAAAHCIYLRVPARTLMARLRRNTKRPLLLVADPERRLQELLVERQPLYEEVATAIVDTAGLSLVDVVEAVVKSCRPSRPQPVER
ncbi:MAG: shikimate kinase, partial [Pseudomonadota bacterium]|nr:shikimate kinase [Pseudomonadota bacterium]